MLPLKFFLCYNDVYERNMKNTFLAFLCSIAASSACFASNEGVPSYYTSNAPTNANRAAYSKYQNYGYTEYVGNSGKKQIVSSQSYSYQVPRPQVPTYSGSTTTNGIAKPAENKTTIYADYSRRFANFEFTTGVNSILEWDDMIFNEINANILTVNWLMAACPWITIWNRTIILTQQKVFSQYPWGNSLAI